MTQEVAKDRPQSASIAADMVIGAFSLRGRTDRRVARASGGRFRHGLRRAFLVGIGLAAVAAALFVAGFLRFATLVVGMEAPADVAADGIVVLTGGADRIAGGIGLLSDGRADRMLISGVHPATRASDIRRALGAAPGVFDCCVDLDYAALDTFGNAEETAKWAREHGLGSLIVVTSAYHMPRSLVEIGRAVPELTLTPFPVARPGLDLRHWYLDGGKIKLLLVEYLKYTAAEGRALLGL